MMLSIVTWNINSLKVRLEQVLDLLHSCDILCLQETKTHNSKFPLEIFQQSAYYCVINGQKQYNGVAIISKYEPIQIVCDIPNYYNNADKRVLTCKINGIVFVCVYVVNGRSVDSEHYGYKLEWLSALVDYVKKLMIVNKKIVILGDFNIAPNDIDIYDPQSFAGGILCSEPEREKWNELLSLGLYDAYRYKNKF